MALLRLLLLGACGGFLLLPAAAAARLSLGAHPNAPHQGRRPAPAVRNGATFSHTLRSDFTYHPALPGLHRPLSGLHPPIDEVPPASRMRWSTLLCVLPAPILLATLASLVARRRRDPSLVTMAGISGTASGHFKLDDLEMQLQRAILQTDALEAPAAGSLSALARSVRRLLSDPDALPAGAARALLPRLLGFTSRLSPGRRGITASALLGLWQNLFGSLDANAREASGLQRPTGGGGPTNEVVRTIDGIRHKRLGGGDIIVSELGLGTQRWGSTDFNAPDEALCHRFLDRAVLGSGVTLVDTAEQYPIPSDLRRPEGLTEEIIGRWHKQDKGRREKLVIATKITGGRNVTRANLMKDCEGSLRRLQTDYIDVYLLHWPARYTPQANWGQSLAYQYDVERAPYYRGATSFEDICLGMGELVEKGMIRGWGICNDNAFGLTKSCEVARRLGVPGPVAMQNDFSLNDRRAEENGVSEASSPIHENVGFMAYNALAGGILTGKYFDGPGPATAAAFRRPRGRFDEPGWGRTLYRYYSAPAMRSAKMYEKLAKDAGMSLAELSLRWCRDRDALTTVLVGHTSMHQLEESLRHFQNPTPLPPGLLAEVDIQHMRNRLPIFCREEPFEEWDGTGDIGEPIP